MSAREPSRTSAYSLDHHFGCRSGSSVYSTLFLPTISSLTSPNRELVEEFAETLSVDLRPEQYVSKPVTTIVENRARSTENIYAPGTFTVRIYRIYEAVIVDSFLPHAMLKRGNDLSHQRLAELAIADAESGGKGKANAVLTLPWERLQGVYRAMMPAERDIPIVFEENRLDSSVAAILEEIAVPRYQSVY